MRHKEIILPSAAILGIDLTVRNWARSNEIKIKIKIPNLAFTRFRIHSGLKNIHSGESIQKVPDSPADSQDTCRRKAYCLNCLDKYEDHSSLLHIARTSNIYISFIKDCLTRIVLQLGPSAEC